MTTSYSEEDRNYLRMVRLLNDVAPKSVRAYFDRIFPPSNLAADLQGHFNTLHHLRFYQKVLTVSQWNILFPPAPASVTSEDFDITLMICLLRNITGITTPVSGYDTLPNPTDVSTGDDLARIKHYRNYIAHSTYTKLSKSRFEDLWNELSQAVERLGGLVFEQMCNDLKSANFDNTDEKVETLEKRILKTEKILEDPVPKHIRERLQNTICRWEKEDEMYVETNMSKSLFKILQKENCITVIGSSGIGKSVTVRHVALQMLAQGYDILLIKHPDDILTYTVNDKQILYVIDDFCGKYNIVHGEVENWNRSTEGLEMIMAESKLKILSCCRLQVYQNCHFKCLNMFTKHPFNINSEAHGLTIAEKRLIAQKYIPDSCSSGLSDDQIRLYDCFPLLCRMVSNTEESRILDFLLNPFDVFQTEINNMFQQYDKMDYCAVMMLILFDNHLSINLLVEDIDSKTREKFDDLFETFGEKRGTSRYRLKDHLDSLIGTYVSLQDDVYRFAHDKIYDMVYSCCSSDMVWCLLKHSSVTSLSARMGCDWMTEIIDEFSIIIPAEKKIVYLERFIKELAPENLLDVFGSKQMNDEGFRQTLIHYLQNLSNDTILKALHLSHIGTNIVHLMCKLGHHDVLTFCLNNECKVNTCDSVGNTPLHIACTYTHKEIVEKLLDLNANVNAYKHRGFTPLFAACMSGNVAIVKQLLLKGAKPNLCSTRKLLPLLMACQNNYHEIAELLLRHGAEPNVKNYKGETALHLACSNNHEKVVRLLIRFGVLIDTTTQLNETPLYYACDKQNVSIVKILVSEKADIFKTSDETKLSPITLMLQQSRHDIAILMLQLIGFGNIFDVIIELFDRKNIQLLNFIILHSPADVNRLFFNGNTILHMACDKGFFEVAQSIIDKGADLNMHTLEGKTAIQLATLHSHKDIVELLIANGAEVNNSHPLCDLPPPLHIACFQNDVDIVQKLVDGNANVNENVNLAAHSGFKLNCTNFMFEQYQKGGIIEKNVFLPLEISCFNQNLDITKILLKGGASTDFKSNFAIDPILIACFYKNKNILELLLTYKANVNNCCNIEVLCRTSIKCSLEGLENNSNCGISPLHVACMNNNEEIVEILIQHRANILLKCDINPCVFAVLKGNQHIRAQNFNSKVIADMYPLHVACFVGNQNIVAKLIAEKSVNNIETPIKLTTQQIVLLHIRLPSFTPNVNVEVCLTPLQISCQCGHWDIATLLIKKGADISSTFIITELPVKGEDDDYYYMTYSEIRETSTIDFVVDNMPDFTVIASMLENVVLSINNAQKLFLQACVVGNMEQLKWLYDKYWKFHILDTTENVLANALLQKDAIVNCKNDNNNTPLHLATKSGDEQMTEYLLQKGADIFCFNKYGETALHFACNSNSLKCVILLLKFTVANLPNLLNSLTDSNDTPLYLAYLQENKEMITTLIGFGADINKTCGKQNGSLLFYACETGKIELVDLLLSHSACTNVYNADRKTPLYVSCEAGYDDITEKILHHGTDVNLCSYQGYGPLYFACRRGNSVIVERLLMAGADPNILSETSVSLLIEACIAGNIRVANCLLQHGADVNFCHYEGETALYFAFNKGDATMMRLLLDYKADIPVCSHEREFYLYEAYKNGMLDIANLISEYDDSIDINAKLLIINNIPDEFLSFEEMVNIHTLYQNTIFHQICLHCSTNGIMNFLLKEIVSPENIENECVYACLEGKLDVFRLFINYCQEKNISINLNRCMILAAGNNELEILNAILLTKYDINEQSEYGYNALHAASAKEQEDIVQTLLNCQSIDVNAKSADGETPLIMAINTQNKSVVTKLLEAGATINYAATIRGRGVKNLFGETIIEKVVNITAIHIACLVDNCEIVSLLLDRHVDCGAMFSIHYQSTDENELYEEMTPIFISIFNNNLKITELLLQNAYSHHCLKSIYMSSNAIYRRGLFNLNDSFIDRKVSISPFQVACLLLRNDIIRAFVNFECVDINDLFIVTPRMLSLSTGNYEKIGDILQKNELKDSDFCTELTPLCYSCLIQDEWIINILFNLGAASVNRTCRISLLHLLAIRYDIDNICLPMKSILSSECTINALSLVYFNAGKSVRKLLLSTSNDFSTESKLSIFHILSLIGSTEHLNSLRDIQFTENVYFTIQDFHLAIMCKPRVECYYGDAYIEYFECNDYITQKLTENKYRLNTLKVSYLQLACFLPDIEVFECILTCPERNTCIELSPLFLSFLFHNKNFKHLKLFSSLPHFTNILSIKFIFWYLCFEKRYLQLPLHLPNIIVNDMSVANELNDDFLVFMCPDTISETHASRLWIPDESLHYNILSFVLISNDFSTLSTLLLKTDVSDGSAPVMCYLNNETLFNTCFIKPYKEAEIFYETVPKFNDICEITILHAACLKEHHYLVKCMVQNNCDVNAVAHLSPLHIALLTDNINWMNRLSIKITKGNPKQCKITAVHILCFKRNASLLKLLSVSTSKFDVYTRDFSTLHLAVLSEYLNVHLTEENYNATSEITPLHIGCITGNTNIVKTLLRKTDFIDVVGSVFPDHISFDYCSCISRCITDKSLFKLTAFHIACLKQNQDSADALIRAGVNLQIPALLAVELSYSNGIYITTKSTLKPLHLACLVQNMPIARMILSKTAQVNETCPISVYHVCYFRNTLQSMDNLLRNTNFTDATILISPLHILCLYGDTEGVQVLLDQTADANLLADLNPAYAFIYCNNETTVEIHIQSNHSVKKSPLHICAEKGDYEICELLVKHGADSNIRTNIGGFQPWHLALYHGHIDVLRCLLMTPLKVHRGQFLFVFVMYIIRKRWSSYILSAILKLKPSILLLSLYKQFMIVFGFIKKNRCSEMNSEIKQIESEEEFSPDERHQTLNISESPENILDTKYTNMSESPQQIVNISTLTENTCDSEYNYMSESPPESEDEEYPLEKHLYVNSTPLKHIKYIH